MSSGSRPYLLQAPCCFHRSHTGADDTDTNDYPTHPDTWTKSGHGQIRGAIEEHIADIEQGQARGDLFRCEMKDLAEVVALSLVHGLGEADIGAYGRAYEVQHPEC